MGVVVKGPPRDGDERDALCAWLQAEGFDCDMIAQIDFHSADEVLVTEYIVGWDGRKRTDPITKEAMIRTYAHRTTHEHPLLPAQLTVWGPNEGLVHIEREG